MKLILTLTIFLLALQVNAQVTQEWVARYNGPGNLFDAANAIAVDNEGNIYVTGGSTGSGTLTDYATIKYNSSGDTLWVQRYNGPANGHDQARAIAVDNEGNVYVTGLSNGSITKEDFLTIKYNSFGVEQWVKRYDGPGNDNDIARAIVVDSEGNVYVTGDSRGSGTGRDYATIKYSSSGVEQWVRRYNGPGNGSDHAYAIAIDNAGDVYVTGESFGGPATGYDYATIKYNSSGDILWVQRYNGPANIGDDGATAIAVDNEDNVYVTGYSRSADLFNFDYATVKYNSAGVEKWVQTYNGSDNDMPSAIAVDNEGSVFVTGTSGPFGATNYATIKYDSLGLMQWVKLYNGPGNSISEAAAIAIDNAGDVYVTGESWGGPATGYDYATIKYNSSGDTLWVQRYNGPANGQDIANAIAVDNEGNVYVTGYSTGSGTARDYATIKYSQTTPLQITKPIQTSKWMAGEIDTIKWTGGQEGQFVQIEYSVDNGNTYEIIDIAVQADFGKFIWPIPDGILSTKVKIKLSDVANPENNVISDKFRIKPYILTRIENGDYYEYRKNRDQWSFSNLKPDLWPSTFYQQFNYQGIDPFTGSQYSQWQCDEEFSTSFGAQFPDWVSFVNTFTSGACYWIHPNLANYKTKAVEKWASVKRKIWRGSCFGIAAANAIAFSYKEQLQTKYPDFPEIINPISVASTDGVKRVVNELFTHQYGNPSIANDKVSKDKFPTETLNEIKQMLSADSSKARTLTIFNHNGGGGHTILAYGLRKDTVLNNIYYVDVYDNSYPDSAHPIIVNTASNFGLGSWTYANYPGWGGNSPGKLYLEIDAAEYFNAAAIPRGLNNQLPFILVENELDINHRSDSQIKITDEFGNTTGFMNNLVFDEIPGSLPKRIKNGSEDPPYGYSLQTDDYSVVLSDFEEDQVETFFFTGNKSFVYVRSGATQTQTDRLFFDGGVSVTNPDAQTKTVKLINLLDESTQEKLTVIRSIELSQNDSVKIENPDSNKIKLISYGSAKEYDLEINFVNETTLDRFVASDINLPANSSHIYVPVWSDITNTQLMILIDEGNNGTIDDTLEVVNQITNPETFQVSISIEDGWNMVSIPGLHPIDQNVNTWWIDRNPAAQVFKFDGGYQSVTNAAPGEGYWMLHSGNRTYSTGDEWPASGLQVVPNQPINANSGWNLIGGYHLTAPTNGITTTPSGLQLGSVFGYSSSSGYSVAENLVPGYAYWILLSSDGQINIPQSSLKMSSSKNDQINPEWGRIIITDNAGNRYTLYGVAGGANLNNYLLPPQPPAGMFDVRYSSGRYAEDIYSAAQTVEMTGVEYPVTVMVENLSIRIEDESGKKLSSLLKSGEEVVISEPSLNRIKVMAEGEVITQYSLSQNYPNPFNPSTTVSYQIPVSGQVTLKVFDVLGNEVAALVDEFREAGRYEVEFQSAIGNRQLASGIYYYRLQAGSFIETKKMMLIK